VPSGRIESQQREFTVVSQTDLQRAQEFEDVIVRTVNNYAVRVKDVARVEVAALNERTNVRFNGRPAISLGLIKQATANPLTLAQALKAELPRIRAELPKASRSTSPTTTRCSSRSRSSPSTRPSPRRSRWWRW